MDVGLEWEDLQGKTQKGQQAGGDIITPVFTFPWDKYGRDAFAWKVNLTTAFSLGTW